MKSDLIKLVCTYIVTFMVMLMGFYALVLYQYALPELVQGAFISFMGAALAFVYGDQAATRATRSAQSSFDAGLAATPNDQMPTVTATTGPPAEVTVEPTGSQG